MDRLDCRGFIVVGCVFLAQAAGAHPEEAVDVRAVGLPWYWLAVGFGAQALFMARFLVQWWTSERMKSSVVPVSFWWLSIFGGLILLIYFLRRGDPVGVLGQSFGVFVYLRNLILIHREAEATRSIEPADSA